MGVPFECPRPRRPLLGILADRARDQGEVRHGFQGTDVFFIQHTLTGLIDRSRALAPDLYRRYLAMLPDGARADPDPIADPAVPPLAVDQTHAVMTSADTPAGKRTPSPDRAAFCPTGHPVLAASARRQHATTVRRSKGCRCGGAGEDVAAPVVPQVATARNCFRRLVARSTVPRFLKRSSPKPDGRPPRGPLHRRAVWLSVFSGRVRRTPRRRGYSRTGPLLRVLPAAGLPGFTRSLPGPDRATRVFPGTTMNRVQSARRPGVTIRGGGRQRPFALRWGSLVSPPRERPRPSPPAPPPPGGRPGSATAFRPGVLPARPPLTRVPEADRYERRPHADAPARRWSPPRCTSRSHPPRRPRPAPAGADVPKCRRPTTAVAFVDGPPRAEPHGPNRTGRIRRCAPARTRCSVRSITCR